MKPLELKTLRELNVSEQANIVAGDGSGCDCGKTCTCDCIAKENAKTKAGGEWKIKSARVARANGFLGV